jgi:hypothetical protein
MRGSRRARRDIAGLIIVDVVQWCWPHLDGRKYFARGARDGSEHPAQGPRPGDGDEKQKGGKQREYYSAAEPGREDGGRNDGVAVVV